MAAGPGAGTPPPEVVGAALHQAKAIAEVAVVAFGMDFGWREQNQRTSMLSVRIGEARGQKFCEEHEPQFSKLAAGIST